MGAWEKFVLFACVVHYLPSVSPHTQMYLGKIGWVIQFLERKQS